METVNRQFLRDFEVGWTNFEKAVSLSDSYSIGMFLAVLRRKFLRRVEFLYGHRDFAALRINLSDVKVRVSAESLVCLIRVKENTAATTSEAFRLLTTAHSADGPAGYCAIAIVCGDTEELKKRCRTSLLDLVTLDRSQLKEIIGANSWTDSLAKVLREESKAEILSPYDEVGICPTEMFFGRDREVQRLTSHAKGHGYSLVGCRRVGKSSLLLRLKQHYDQIGEPTYYIDCQTCRSTGAFYEEIIKRTNRKDYESRRQWTLKSYLIRLASKHNKPLNLFLDEIDWVVAFDAGSQFEYIRELLSAETTKTIPFRLWMAGFKDLYRAVTDTQGPLYGKTRAVELNSLPYEEAKHLISKPLSHLGYGFEDRNSIINRIYEDTAGHPAFVQLYCRLLVDVMVLEEQTKIKLDHLNSVREENDFVDYVLDTFTINTSALEKMIVLSVLDGKQFTQPEVKEALYKKYDIKLDHRPLYDELRDLRFGGILRETAGRFSFQYPIMTDVIKEIGNAEYIGSEYIEKARETAGRVNARA